MKWINFLHIYQPVNMDAEAIKEATEKSYLRIIRALEEHPELKFTININGSLIIRWEDLGYQKLLERLKKLLDKKQIELVGTACYHPILPLIPQEEMRGQIRENEEILRKYFGQDFKARGFYFPEMAYSKEAALMVKSLGYEWIILDEIAYSGKVGHVDCSKIYLDQNSDLKVILRSRQISNKYVPEEIEKILSEKDQEEKIVVSGTDGELYGLKHIDHTAVFEKILKNPNLKTSTISEYIDSQENFSEIKIKPHSWATTEEEYRKNQPFNLWNNKSNKIHQKLWELANLVHKTVEENKDDKHFGLARWYMVRGFASCSFWWASGYDFKLFGGVAWSPDEIERGLNELIRAIRSLDNASTRKNKIRAEKLNLEIKDLAWKKHWKQYWQ